jgi:hypothetical protein
MLLNGNLVFPSKLLSNELYLMLVFMSLAITSNLLFCEVCFNVHCMIQEENFLMLAMSFQMHNLASI